MSSKYEPAPRHTVTAQSHRPNPAPPAQRAAVCGCGGALVSVPVLYQHSRATFSSQNSSVSATGMSWQHTQAGVSITDLGARLAPPRALGSWVPPGIVALAGAGGLALAGYVAAMSALTGEHTGGVGLLACTAVMLMISGGLVSAVLWRTERRIGATISAAQHLWAASHFCQTCGFTTLPDGRRIGHGRIAPAIIAAVRLPG
ncbi:hypothetical protein [Catenuloplanes atrovinosus]|uniref:Uncharacterized protein n=1 Tax=Catenuloplanes atrovinosus TaxID=137266 RepID=A0AAE4CB17_9ACTN|nr:hypothetical protein [Catenuloplanes atrovinosus]MDR7277587.1 hypothetical protein [Catenuloplanes atrovinosus]